MQKEKDLIRLDIDNSAIVLVPRVWLAVLQCRKGRIVRQTTRYLPIQNDVSQLFTPIHVWPRGGVSGCQGRFGRKYAGLCLPTRCCCAS